MKLAFIIILFGLLGVSTVYGQTGTTSKIEFKVEKDYWEGCETGEGECQPLIITRTSIQDKILFIMPCGGTFTTVHLSKTGYEEPIKSLSIEHAECPPAFDLTGLSDGNYEANMLSCGLGGRIKLELLTKNK